MTPELRLGEGEGMSHVETIAGVPKEEVTVKAPTQGHVWLCQEQQRPVYLELRGLKGREKKIRS